MLPNRRPLAARTRRSLAAFLVTAATATLFAAAVAAETMPQLRLIGQQTFDNRTLTFEGTVPGGLSGIEYDASSGHYVVISDDQSVPERGDARFYTVELDFDARAFRSFTFTGVTVLKRPDGKPFPASGVDPESIRLLPSGHLLWTSEGLAESTPPIAPFVREMRPDGSYVRDLTIPRHFIATSVGAFGGRHNLVFESLTITPGGRWAVTATEGALLQDGPEATSSTGSPSRVLFIDLETGEPGPEYVYMNDPVTDATDAFSVNGLVELLALDESSFLALERSFSVGFGNSVDLYRFDVSAAADISTIDSLANAEVRPNPGAKTLVADLTCFGVTLDNLEGLTWGPKLETGNPSLVIVSDDNFGYDGFTQFLAFEVLSKP